MFSRRNLYRYNTQTLLWLWESLLKMVAWKTLHEWYVSGIYAWLSTSCSPLCPQAWAPPSALPGGSYWWLRSPNWRRTRRGRQHQWHLQENQDIIIKQWDICIGYMFVQQRFCKTLGRQFLRHIPILYVQEVCRSFVWILPNHFILRYIVWGAHWKPMTPSRHPSLNT